MRRKGSRLARESVFIASRALVTGDRITVAFEVVKAPTGEGE